MIDEKIYIIWGVFIGHATCEFKDKMWLIGGRTAEYDTWNLQATERNADVWSTEDGGQFVLNTYMCWRKHLRGLD